MYILERKELYIVKEPLRKNRCFQSYRWKQYAICSEKEPLQKIIDNSKRPREWRIEETPVNLTL